MSGTADMLRVLGYYLVACGALGIFLYGLGPGVYAVGAVASVALIAAKVLELARVDSNHQHRE